MPCSKNTFHAWNVRVNREVSKETRGLIEPRNHGTSYMAPPSNSRPPTLPRENLKTGSNRPNTSDKVPNTVRCIHSPTEAHKVRQALKERLRAKVLSQVPCARINERREEVARCKALSRDTPSAKRRLVMACFKEADSDGSLEGKWG